MRHQCSGQIVMDMASARGETWGSRLHRAFAVFLKLLCSAFSEHVTKRISMK